MLLAVVPTQPPVHGYWVSFLGVKQLGHGVNLPPSSSAGVKEVAELYQCSHYDLLKVNCTFKSLYLCTGMLLAR
jgi:hypothetical protein